MLCSARVCCMVSSGKFKHRVGCFLIVPLVFRIEGDDGYYIVFILQRDNFFFLLFVSWHFHPKVGKNAESLHERKQKKKQKKPESVQQLLPKYTATELLQQHSQLCVCVYLSVCVRVWERVSERERFGHSGNSAFFAATTSHWCLNWPLELGKKCQEFLLTKKMDR